MLGEYRAGPEGGREAKQLADMCERDRRPVEINLPWKKSVMASPVV